MVSDKRKEGTSLEKTGRRNKAIVVTVCILAIGLFSVAGALLIRQDWRFSLTQRVSALFRDIEWKQVEISDDELFSTTFAELRAREDVRVDESLVLVNADHPIREKNFSLEEYKDTGLLMNTCASQAYSQLSAAILEQTGQKLYINNSYRSKEEQEEVFAQEGSSTSARPGESEHETGLAMDVYVYGLAGPGFLKSKAGQFVASEGYQYGFIVRYPQGKSNKTGISYEPWHIRYVGSPHAEILYCKNWCLEEYFEHMKVGEFYRSGEYLITRQPKGKAIRFPKGMTDLTVSEDNMGNVVITGRYPNA